MGETMGTHEPEQDGNLEIEVGPLRSPSSEAPSVVSDASRSLFASAHARRSQLRRGIAVTGALVVVLVGLVMTIIPTREALRGIVFGPTPTATAPVPLGEDKLYISLNPGWGTVTLDDKKLSHLPMVGVEQPLRLTRGGHVLRWMSPPIIDYACRLTVPSLAGDTCPLQTGILPGNKGLASTITLQLSLTLLTPGYRKTLLAAIQTALDSQQSSDIIQSGEHYRGASPAIATEPLKATLRFLSDAENSQAQCPDINSGPGVNCMMNGDCRELCTAPWQTPQNASVSLFQAYIIAHASWRITTLDGRIIVKDQPDASGLGFLGDNENPVPISIGWSGSQWKVTTTFGVGGASDHFNAPGCRAVQDDIDFQVIVPPELPGSAGGGVGVGWMYIQGDPSASGCLAAALPITMQGMPDTSPQGLSEAGLILYRFGISLAANPAAHRYWPWMPVADAYEQAIARALAQKLPGATGMGH